MTPIYEYECSGNHRQEHIRPMDRMDAPARCRECKRTMRRVMSLTAKQVDGIYSHEPNLGDPNTFERRHEEAKAKK